MEKTAHELCKTSVGNVKTENSRLETMVKDLSSMKTKYDSIVNDLRDSPLMIKSSEYLASEPDIKCNGLINIYRIIVNFSQKIGLNLGDCSSIIELENDAKTKTNQILTEFQD